MKTAKAKSTSSDVTCSGCKFPVHKEVHYALGCQWHRNCFRCSECLSTIPQHYMPRDNILYCMKDYLIKFGQHCQRCLKQITGPVMVAGEQKYHTECFVCTKCLKFIGYGDEYMLVERHNLYCNLCYKRTILPAISTPVSQLDNCHTIQHINLKPTPVGRRKFSVLIEKGSIASKLLNSNIAGEDSVRKSFIAIENVDASSELKARGVKSGDKVLEVNDIVVTDDTLDKLSQIISNPHKVHTLTIERNTSSQPSSSIEANTAKPVEIAKTTPSVKSPNTKRPIGRYPSLDLLGSCDYDQKFKRNHSTSSHGEEDVFDCNAMLPTNSADDSHKTRKKERANSLPRSNSVDNSVLLCNSPLHRSQSMKSSETEAGKAFRPSELIIGEVIGKGFFGQVSKVVHRGTGNVMVLKELIRCDGLAQKQFIKEVTLLKTLDHPNVLKFIGILYKNKVLSLIAEYVAGGTLRGIIKDKTRELSWSQRVKFAKDITLGMDYLHSMNVIHRDLKSKNCLVRNDEGLTIVVADFGLAGMMSIEQEVNESTSPDQNNNAHKINFNHLSSRPPAPKKRTTVVGSPYWMAPEMIQGNGYDERVDVFSFGIIVCEIISRVKADPDFIPRTRSFGLDEQAFEGKFCQSCPKPFFQIACLCCDIEPRNRPTFSSLVSWLEALLVHLEIGIPLPAQVQISLLPKTMKTPLPVDVKETNLAR